MRTVVKFIIPLLVVGFAIGLVSFANKEERQPLPFCAAEIRPVFRFDRNSGSVDTMPADRLTARLEEALEKLEYQLQNLQWQMKRLEEQQVNDAYKKVGAEKEFYRQKMQEDWQLAEAKTRLALRDADRQFTIQLRAHNDDMARVLNKSAKQLAEQSQRMARDVEAKTRVQLQLAHKELLRNNQQLDELRRFQDDLEQDKLINRAEGYTIEVKKGDLYINGKKQSASVSKRYKEKYKHYFEGDGTILLKSDGKKRTFRSKDNELI